ncbi:hypothetical protein [Vibrio sp. D431a]|uniref:hypothetical protein n=1 Tax=Vibrio sp. D431a TaxID=2837388 RepID=UPI0025556F5D|nr:hypothetical protein [Vibrio sp. D431a]MDK9789787.1 hypothetical protein [Vibrio sp. D431a]
MALNKNALDGITPELLDELIVLRNQKTGTSLEIIKDHLLNNIMMVEAAKKIGVKDVSTASKTLTSLLTIHERAISYVKMVNGSVEDNLAGINAEQWDVLLKLRNQRTGKASEIVRNSVLNGIMMTEAARQLGTTDISTASNTLKRFKQCHLRAITYVENYLHFKLVENVLSIEGSVPDLGVNEDTLTILLALDDEITSYKSIYAPEVAETLQGINAERFNTLARLYQVEMLNKENLSADWSLVSENSDINVKKALAEAFEVLTGGIESTPSSAASYIIKNLEQINASIASKY